MHNTELELIILTGLSGAGKSTALKILEDYGYYCIDNYPVPLIEEVISLYMTYEYKRIAISIDARSKLMFEILSLGLNKIRSKNIVVKFLFLDATDDILIKRFFETRRKHPLSNGRDNITTCINQERNLLSSFIDFSPYIIDTSIMNANTLRGLVREFIAASPHSMNIILQSFGFKYGNPLDSDLLFDVRCLPNPFYHPKLKNLTGLDLEVIEFLEQEKAVPEMVNDIFSFINKWLPHFYVDNRTYVTVSIGCTGGKHRSVYIAEKIANLIKMQKYNSTVRHLTLNVESSKIKYSSK